jgi:predicted amidophosphoribosyltransferase
MTCSNCRKKIEKAASHCPHCGQPTDVRSGTFQTSTVLISTLAEDHVYRTVDEVPPRLRTRLLKSTNGGNSATILIADRRGRTEIARALRKLPSPAQRKLRRTVLGAPTPASWITPGRRKAIMAVVMLVCLALIAFVFSHRW